MTTSRPIPRPRTGGSGRRPAAWLLLVALASIAVLIPNVNVRAAEPVEPWEAAIFIQKHLDRDGQLATDDDRGFAGSGWQFELSIVGSEPDPITVTTDEEGSAEAYLEVTTETAEIRVTEISGDTPLVGVYGNEPEETTALPITDRGVTLPVDSVRSLWGLDVINQGTPVVGVDTWVESLIDKDGDLDTVDLVPGANWVYDVEVGESATVEPSTVDTGRDGDEGAAWIEMTDQTTTLRITQRARDGYELLDAFAVFEEDTVGALEGRTLTVEVDLGMGELEIVFINHKTGPAPTASPDGAVQGATGTPKTTLPPTDELAGTSRPGSPIVAFVVLALVGLVSVGLLASHPRRQDR
jgi:hypothetical protein